MKRGNIGVMLSDDNGALHRIRFVGEDLIKIESLDNGFTRWLYPKDFWVVLDNLPL